MRSSQKTAIITPFGLFEYLCMPFGLKNAAQAFQRLMDVVCKDLPFVFVYLDDILIASSSAEEHCTHLRTLFQRLTNNGLLLNPNKCEFGCTEIDFLGYRISPDGIRHTSSQKSTVSRVGPRQFPWQTVQRHPAHKPSFTIRSRGLAFQTR